MFKTIDNNLLQRFLLVLLACEWLAFVLSGVSFSFLHNDPFFSIGVDPVYWLFYGIGIPQAIVTQQWMAIAADIMIFLLLALLIKNPSNNKIAFTLMLMLLLFYVTLTGYHTHRNYQAGFFLVLVPFIFKPEKSRQMAYEAARYFLLFFYTSSAVLKLFSSSLYDGGHFSHVLTQQFVPYFLEGNTGWRTDLNLYLVNHPGIAQVLFVAGFIVELVTVIGFFTKRFDRQLAILLLSFHFVNWILMDIAPIGQLAFICLLFMKRAFAGKAGN
jgi:hypothetical protein